MSIITPALLSALNTVVSKNFSDQYARTREASFYQAVATVVPSSTAMNTYAWLKDFPALREWIGNRVVKDMETVAYQIVNRLYESTVGVPRTAIDDDQFGHYGLLAANMGQAAAEHPERLISKAMKEGITNLCYDGQFFFDTDHPIAPNEDGTGVAVTVANYVTGLNPGWFLLDTRGVLKPFIYQERDKPELDTLMNPKTTDSVFTTDAYQFGIRTRAEAGYGFWQQAFFSKATLDAAAFEAAVQGMEELTADGGRPLGISPSMLVVPPALRATANKLINNLLIAGGESNPNYQAVEVKVVPWLVGV